MTSTPPADSGMPYQPLATRKRSEGSRHPGQDAPLALKVAMVVLAVASILTLTAIGVAAGVAWLFMACFAESCSDTSIETFFLPPAIGLSFGLGLAGFLGWKRAWFYRHPAVIWASVVLMVFIATAVFSIAINA